MYSRNLKVGKISDSSCVDFYKSYLWDIVLFEVNIRQSISLKTPLYFTAFAERFVRPPLLVFFV